LQPFVLAAGDKWSDLEITPMADSRYRRFPGATIRGFKMDEEDAEALKASAKKLKLTLSDTMRRAIRELAEKLGVQPTKAA